LFSRDVVAPAAGQLALRAGGHARHVADVDDLDQREVALVAAERDRGHVRGDHPRQDVRRQEGVVVEDRELVGRARVRVDEQA
jgi:hypothetical protein